MDIALDQVDFPSHGPTAVLTETGEASRLREGEGGFPRSKRPHPITGGRKIGPSGRPHTPSLRSPRHNNSHTHHVHHLHRPSTPTGHGPSTSTLTSFGRPGPILLQRAHSSTGGAGMPITQSASLGLISPALRSAKRWARSAHLHEVKSATLPRKDWAKANRTRHSVDATEGNHGEEDVFGSRVESTPRTFEDTRPIISRRERSPSRHYYRGRMGSQKQISQSLQFQSESDIRGGVRSEGGVSEGEGWVDTDADVDVDGTDVDDCEDSAIVKSEPDLGSSSPAH